MAANLLLRVGKGAVHPAKLSVDEFLLACKEVHVKRSGPGGQHRNKVATGVVLTHVPTGISAEGAERRSQVENRINAIKRLRLQIALQERTSVSPWIPSELFVRRYILLQLLLLLLLLL